MPDDQYDNSEDSGEEKDLKEFYLEVNIKPIGFTITAETEDEAISKVKDKFSEEFNLAPKDEEIKTIDVVELDD